MHNTFAPPVQGASGVGEGDDTLDNRTAVGTLWVVDDTEAIQVLARSVFERAGWRVSTFEDLTRALEALADGPTPDAVLLDIHLPDGNGLHHVREFAAAGAAVVVVSNAAGPDQVELAFAVGAGDVVPKPFDLRSLLARVERAARAARPERAMVPLPESRATAAHVGGPDSG
ncbi:MAG TPA: response regulator [Trueperaceae bacterium]